MGDVLKPSHHLPLRGAHGESEAGLSAAWVAEMAGNVVAVVWCVVCCVKYAVRTVISRKRSSNDKLC